MMSDRTFHIAEQMLAEHGTVVTTEAGVVGHARALATHYFPRLQGADTGLVIPQATALLSASMLSPTPWPFMTTQGQQNAYVWLSKELCCSDIRASYINLNIDPTVWLVGMNQLVYPQDQSTNFSTDDFYDVRSQLATEFGYVSVIRNLQTNILGLYQSQQSNVGLILQQAELDVQSSLYTNTPPPPIVQAISWSTFASDVLPTLANLAGFIPEGGVAVKTALGIATLAINSAVDHTNSSSGASQSAVAWSNQSLVASQVAQHAVDEYTESLLTLGNDFSRILPIGVGSKL